MADHNTQSSFVIQCGTADNARKVADWLNGSDYPDELLDAMNEASDGAFDDDGVLQFTIAEASVPADEPDAVWVDFQDGDLALVAAIVEYAMTTMPEVPSPQGWEWANTCSRPRPGEFSGGAVVVSRGAGTQWHTTGQWLDEALSAAIATGAP
jgi:hypothetical protein